MRRLGTPITALILAGTLLASASPSAAEPYLAGFLGAAITENKDLGIQLGVHLLGPIADGNIKDVALTMRCSSAEKSGISSTDSSGALSGSRLRHITSAPASTSNR